MFDTAKSKKFTSHTTLIDVTNEKKLCAYIERINPDYIVNCVGVLVGGSNNNIGNAVLINSYLPHLLVRVASKINSILIHISTDCVFSGKKGGYIEVDCKDGQGVYAQTKILGEIFDSKNPKKSFWIAGFYLFFFINIFQTCHSFMSNLFTI